jgi:YfiH family protein
VTPVLDARRPPIAVPVAEDPAVRAVFSGRVALSAAANANLSLVVGDGDVAAARREALALIGAAPASTVFMEQVHAGEVAVVGAAQCGRGSGDHADAIAGVDALVTFSPDVAVAVLVADCVPVLLADPGRGVAAVHAGRRGVQAQIVPAAVRALAGTDTAGVVALIGPAIGGCCYEVPAALRDQLARRWPQAAGHTTWGSPSLDLPAAVTAQLAGMGVARIEHVGGCTHCTPASWFSHRVTKGAPAGVTKGAPAAVTKGAPAAAAPGGAGWAAGRQAGMVVRRGPSPPARPPSAPCLDLRS